MIFYAAGQAGCIVQDDRQSSLTRVDESTCLIAAIAHELGKIRGSNGADLWLDARQMLTEAFRSIEHDAQPTLRGEPSGRRVEAQRLTGMDEQ